MSEYDKLMMLEIIETLDDANKPLQPYYIAQEIELPIEFIRDAFEWLVSTGRLIRIAGNERKPYLCKWSVSASGFAYWP